MKCIKDEEITLQGNQQTGIANNFQIVFDRCNPDERECKNDDEFYSDILTFLASPHPDDIEKPGLGFDTTESYGD